MMKRLLAAGTFALLAAYFVPASAAVPTSTARPGAPAAHAARRAAPAVAGDVTLTFSEFPQGTPIVTAHPGCSQGMAWVGNPHR